MIVLSSSRHFFEDEDDYEDDARKGDFVLNPSLPEHSRCATVILSIGEYRL
jgi:hypothetical protein